MLLAKALVLAPVLFVAGSLIALLGIAGRLGWTDGPGWLAELSTTIAERAASGDASSYTRQLLNAGVERIAQPSACLEGGVHQLPPELVLTSCRPLVPVGAVLR